MQEKGCEGPRGLYPGTFLLVEHKLVTRPRILRVDVMSGARGSKVGVIMHDIP